VTERHNRRAGDGSRWRRVAGHIGRWWTRYGRDVVPTLAVALAAYAVVGATTAARDARHAAHGAQAAVRQSNRETAARVDQTCAISEAKQRSDSDALIRTYQYLSSLTGHQLAQPINRAILANLPVTIRAAQIDDAPAFCDKPGVGLPEPDPPLPCVPKHVKGCIARPRNLPPG
jgi:hypothetical protein